MRILECVYCGQAWELSGGGRAPKLCPPCRESWRACTDCESIRPVGDFAKGQRRCKPCGSARTAAWQQANPEKERARSAAYYAANPEKERARKSAYRTDNREKERARSAAWQRANPDKARAKNLRRRAHKRDALTIPHTAEALTAHMLKLGDACMECGGPWEHIDHAVPLARGGAHALFNLRPLCASCNLSKNAKLLGVHVAAQRQALKALGDKLTPEDWAKTA